MADLFILIGIAVLWGYVEQHIYNSGYSDLGEHIAGLSPRYHFPLWGMWIGICYLSGYWWFVPAFAMIEDFSYFLFNPNDFLDESDWINFGLGGLRLWNVWIPTMYFIALGLTLILYIIN